jgi:hypothetical protein
VSEWRLIGPLPSSFGGYLAEYHLYQNGEPVPLGIDDSRINVVYRQGRGDTPEAAISAASEKLIGHA